MIIFSSPHLELYNYVIHNALETEIFYDSDLDIEEIDVQELGDRVENFTPKYLFREQFRKCLGVFKELYYWTKDSFYHELTAFHEYLLYSFLDFLVDIQRDIPEFNDIYFDEKARDLLNRAAEKNFEEEKEEFEELTMEDCMETLTDFSYYRDYLSIDQDFLFLDEVYNSRYSGSNFLEERLGINLDYYFDILPLDIQKQYGTGHINLTGEMSSFLDYFNHRTKFGSLNKLFWENGAPVKEKKIQVILENILDAYFENKKVDISREALSGAGQIDFKIYRNQNQEEKVLIEVKLASSPKWKRGYEKQLQDYLQSTGWLNGFYLVACYTDDEVSKIENFIRENVYTEHYQLYLNIRILDLRLRESASK